MKVLFLYSPNLSNHYVINHIAKKHEVFKIAEQQNHLNILSRVLDRKHDTVFSKIDKLLFFGFYALFIQSKLEKHLSRLFEGSEHLAPELMVKDINHTDAIQFARAINADIIFVLGTTLLHDEWLNIGKPIINAHTGILPKYRGRFCWFWPIYNEEFSQVGVSIHHIEKRADAGYVIIRNLLDLEKIGQVNIYSILSALPKLILRGFEDALKSFTGGELFGSSPRMQEKLYPIFLEPGLSQYLRFKKIIRKNFPRKSIYSQ